MNNRSNLRYSPDGRTRAPLGAFLGGFVFALLLLVAAAWAYLKYGHPPVAAADPAFPMEAQIVHVPLGARIAREVETSPIGTSEEAFESGARIYRASCASCHGTPGQDSPYGKWMYPGAPQLFKKHRNGNVVGVSDDEAGESYWKIKNGIRLTGMPAFQRLYSETQMWQVALLLKNADQPLPDPVLKLLQPSSSSPQNPLQQTSTPDPQQIHTP